MAEVGKSEVVADLRHYLSPSSSSSSNNEFEDEEKKITDVALPVAAMQALLGVIKRSSSTTMMGLQEELRMASEEMTKAVVRKKKDTKDDDESGGDCLYGDILIGRSRIALSSGCELFMKYVTRTFLELPDFAACKELILERGERVATVSLTARDRISNVAGPFIRDGATVLTHGRSRVVSALLRGAARAGRQFSVLVTEGRPNAAGIQAAKLFAMESNIRTTVILDSAAAHVMERVDLVVVGAEAVVENGGVVNKIGTYGMALAARALGKPFYVAAESYKFARLYPLNQSDLPDMGGDGGITGSGLSFVDTTAISASSNTNKADTALSKNVQSGIVNFPTDLIKVENPHCDYTPAEYITLLFTDLGVLTPSAVSDELIRLYQ